MPRVGFARVDKDFGRVYGELKDLRTDVTDLKVGVARIEGHLGIGFPAEDTEQGPSAVEPPGAL